MNNNPGRIDHSSQPGTPQPIDTLLATLDNLRGRRDLRLASFTCESRANQVDYQRPWQVGRAECIENGVYRRYVATVRHLHFVMHMRGLRRESTIRPITSTQSVLALVNSRATLGRFLAPTQSSRPP